MQHFVTIVPNTKFYRNQFSLYVGVENLRALKWLVIKQL